MTDAWSLVLDAAAAEFSDLPDAAEVTVVGVRLVLAALLGGLLGWEREYHGKAAGMRTHMLLAMGAALFMLAPERIGATDADLTRVIQGVTAGIGFLCAGTILKGTDPGNVKGLTTAAGLWLTAAVGVAVGLGHNLTAILGTGLALSILALLPRIERRLPRARPQAASAGLTPVDDD